MNDLPPGHALALIGARTNRELARRIAAKYGSWIVIGVNDLSLPWEDMAKTVVVENFPATVEAFEAVKQRAAGSTLRFILVGPELAADPASIDPIFTVYAI